MLNKLVERPLREHPRVSGEITVRVECEGLTFVAQARDLSMVGVFLEIDQDLPDIVPLRIVLPDAEIVTRGRVERVTDEGVALSFAHIEWDDLLVLARYVAPKL